MADKYLNYTVLNYYHNRLKTLFPSITDFDTLEQEVQDLIAEGGEPNVIEIVQKNGVALPVTNKTVNVIVPVSVSELTNDGDGTSAFATQEYVDENGGKIDSIAVNGTTQTITNKKVDILIPITQIKVNNNALTPDSTHAVNVTVPTNVSDLTNDADYQDATEVQALIDDALADITGIDFQVVTQLPATGTKGVIYLVSHDGSAPDIYDEYIWLSATSSYEKIGTTVVDLSNYWSKTELVAITTAEIDAIIGA